MLNTIIFLICDVLSPILLEADNLLSMEAFGGQEILVRLLQADFSFTLFLRSAGHAGD